MGEGVAAMVADPRDHSDTADPSAAVRCCGRHKSEDCGVVLFMIRRQVIIHTAPDKSQTSKLVHALSLELLPGLCDILTRVVMRLRVNHN